MNYIKSTIILISDLESIKFEIPFSFYSQPSLSLLEINKSYKELFQVIFYHYVINKNNLNEIRHLCIFDKNGVFRFKSDIDINLLDEKQIILKDTYNNLDNIKTLEDINNSEIWKYLCHIPEKFKLKQIVQHIELPYNQSFERTKIIFDPENFSIKKFIRENQKIIVRYNYLTKDNRNNMDIFHSESKKNYLDFRSVIDKRDFFYDYDLVYNKAEIKYLINKSNSKALVNNENYPTTYEEILHYLKSYYFKDIYDYQLFSLFNVKDEAAELMDSNDFIDSSIWNAMKIPSNFEIISMEILISLDSNSTNKHLIEKHFINFENMRIVVFNYD